LYISILLVEGLELLSLLHTVGLFFFFPFQVLSVLFTKPTDSTREREKERESERERQVVLTITK
jgi:membrane protein implicated in regulation of membrane protease activity